jgi:hypothetical protein
MYGTTCSKKKKTQLFYFLETYEITKRQPCKNVLRLCFCVWLLGSKRSCRPVHCFFYAFQAENTPKDVASVGATSNAGYYKRITHFFHYSSVAVPVGACDAFHTVTELFCYCSCPV